MTPDILSLVPPLIAVGFSLWTRRIVLSLFLAVLAGLLMLHTFSIAATVTATFELFTGLLTTGWILKTLGFVLLVGAIMELMRLSGGIDAMIDLLSHQTALVRSRRRALLLVYLTGVVIFIESSITALVAGAIGRPLAGRFGFSREKLAMVCDSTSAPICSLIVVNGWGALLLGLIATQIQAGQLGGDAVGWLMQGVLFNFYAMSALMVTLWMILKNWDIGPMRAALPASETASARQHGRGRLSFMLLPLVLMVGGVFFFLWLTGEGNLLKGSGSSAVFYTVVMTLGVMVLQYRFSGVLAWKVIGRGIYGGVKALVPVSGILLMAFAIGKVIGDVGTGLYLASFIDEELAAFWLPAAVFAVSGLMAFATGTSWGTFSVMLPIAIVTGGVVDAPPALLIGAVISGGVFGDHCSPISDTTIISSMAAGCDPVAHVRTQLPYALISGAMALFGFLAGGWLLQ